MKILVTGGAGFIGSITSALLLKAGHDCHIADNFSNSSPAALERIEQAAGKKPGFTELDLCDREGVAALFARERFDAVIHFAGLKAVGESVAEPLRYYHNNLVSTLNLLDAMKENGCKKIVYSSSATVYGTGGESPFSEDAPTGATNPYGYTKLFIEQILRDAANADPAFSVVLLRYFNPIGADESGLLGEAPNGIPNNIFPYIAKVALGVLPEICVFGDDYDTPDGTGVRDYIHVADLAEGHLLALRYAAEHTGTEVFNLGTGHGTSVYELIAAFEKACGKTLPKRVTERRPGDIATCYAATEKAEKLLGFKAKRNLDKMCEDGWRFVKANRDLPGVK